MFVVKLTRRGMHPLYLGLRSPYTADISQAQRFESEDRAIRYIAGLSHGLSMAGSLKFQKVRTAKRVMPCGTPWVSLMVPSEFRPAIRYKVTLFQQPEVDECTCKDFEFRGSKVHKCKHILSARQELKLPVREKIVEV